MNAPTDPHARPAQLPRAIVKKMRWPFPFIWIVPLGAAILTGYFLWDKMQSQGPEIVIQFSNGTNLKDGQTPVEIRGVRIGEVSRMDLTPDRKNVLVHVRLHRDQADVARKNTVFWMVRPEISLQAVTGLGAILSGPYIQAEPGGGDRQTFFQGFDSAPIIAGPVLHIVLVSERVESVQPETPVTYRGIQVGAVEEIQLGENADHADIVCVIQDRYTPLIRSNSQFWTVAPADIHGGVFTGVKVKLQSLSALISGQIAFATPEEDAGEAVSEGSRFLLHDKVDSDWLSWKPQIPISPAPEKAIKPESQQKVSGMKQP